MSSHTKTRNLTGKMARVPVKATANTRIFSLIVLTVCDGTFDLIRGSRPLCVSCRMMSLGGLIAKCFIMLRERKKRLRGRER